MPNLPGFTREETARKLNISMRQLATLQSTGRLKPKKDKDGILRFTRASVHEEMDARRLKEHDRRGLGRLAAEVFRLLEDGKGLADIVIAVQAIPEDVEKLHAQWTRLKGITTSSQPCIRCKNASARFCGGCVEETH